MGHECKAYFFLSISAICDLKPKVKLLCSGLFLTSKPPKAGAEHKKRATAISFVNQQDYFSLTASSGL